MHCLGPMRLGTGGLLRGRTMHGGRGDALATYRLFLSSVILDQTRAGVSMRQRAPSSFCAMRCREGLTLLRFAVHAVPLSRQRHMIVRD